MNENIATSKDIGIGKILLVFLLSIISSLIFVKIYSIIPGFIETFSSFSSNLPLPTNFVLSLYPAYLVIAFIFLLPFIVILTKKISLRIRRKMLLLSLVLLLVSIAYLGFVIWAMYLPVFELGPIK